MDMTPTSIEALTEEAFTTLSSVLREQARGELAILHAELSQLIETANLFDFKNPRLGSDGERRWNNEVVAAIVARVAALDARLTTLVQVRIAEIQDWLNAEAEAAGVEPITVTYKAPSDEGPVLDSEWGALFARELLETLLEDVHRAYQGSKKLFELMRMVGEKLLASGQAKQAVTAAGALTVMGGATAAGATAAAGGASGAGAAAAAAAEGTTAAGTAGGALVAAAPYVAVAAGAAYLGYRGAGAASNAGRKDAELILNRAAAHVEHDRTPALHKEMQRSRDETISELRRTGLAQRSPHA